MSGLGISVGEGRDLHSEPLIAHAQLAALGRRFFPWGQLADKKRTKVPLRTSGRLGNSTNSSAWTTLADAERAAADLARRPPEAWQDGLAGLTVEGIGVALGLLEDGRWLVGLDPDLCRLPVTRAEPIAVKVKPDR